MSRNLLTLAISLLAAVAQADDNTGSKIALRTSDGRTLSPLANEGQKVTVLVFLMHDCPVTNASAPELGRLAAEFTPKGIRFFGVYASETAQEIATHRRDYGLPFDGLMDPDLRLAKIAGATCAPEAAVISSDGKLLYRGRIDDRAVKLGTMRPTAKQRDLYLALQAVLEGREPNPRFTPSIGSYLPTKK